MFEFVGCTPTVKQKSPWLIFETGVVLACQVVPPSIDLKNPSLTSPSRIAYTMFLLFGKEAIFMELFELELITVEIFELVSVNVFAFPVVDLYNPLFTTETKTPVPLTSSIERTVKFVENTSAQVIPASVLFSTFPGVAT